MVKIIINSWALFTGMGFLMMAYGFQGSLLGVRAVAEEFSLMATGFMLSTLQPVIEIIRIFDVGRNIPDKFFNDSLPPDRFEIERKWLTDQE